MNESIFDGDGRVKVRPVTHQLAPFYEEEKVTTSPFPLKGAIE